MLTEEQERKIREFVLYGAKEIYRANLVDFGEGNVSMRIKKADEMIITPTRNDYSNLTAEELVYIKFDGRQLSTGKPPSSEYRLHAAIYQARPKAKCVIHTHSTYACILGAARQKIPVLLEEMLLFLGGEIEVAEFTPAGTEDIGKTALEAMGDRNGVLLTNHGAVVCGKDMLAAVKNAKLLEKMAQIYWGAVQLGEVNTIDPKYWKKWRELYHGLYSTAPRKPKGKK